MSKPKSQSPKEPKIKTWPVEMIPREMIHEAEYNPRTISEHGRKLLRTSLQKHGLFDTLCWNKRTGRLVSGHQKLSLMDSEERTRNYKVPVTVIDVDEVQEKEINLQANNLDAQGMFDRDKLFSLFQSTPTLKLENAGMSIRSLELQFGTIPPFLLPTVNPPSNPLSNLASTLPDASGNVPPSPDPSPSAMLQGTMDPKMAEEQAKIQSIKDRKKEYRQDDNASAGQDASYWIQVVFKSNEDREAFLKHYSLMSGSRYVLADELEPLLKETWRVSV